MSQCATVNETITAHVEAVTNFSEQKEAAGASIRRHLIIDCCDDFTKMAKDLAGLAHQHADKAKKAAAQGERAPLGEEDIPTRRRAINKLIAVFLGQGTLKINPIDEATNSTSTDRRSQECRAKARRQEL